MLHKLTVCLVDLLLYFLPDLFTSLLTYFFDNRLVPFPGQRSYKVTEPGFSFLVCLFCVVVYFAADACLIQLCLIYFFWY